MKRRKLWIKRVVKPEEKGLFHKQLGVPVKQRIPKTLVKEIVETPIGKKVRNPTKIGKKSMKVTRLMKQRAVFALNVGYGRYKRRK